MAHLIEHREATREYPRFRVWANLNMGAEVNFYAVESPEEAGELINRLSKAARENSYINTTVYGLEELEEDGQYHEWYNESGDDIDSLSNIDTWGEERGV